MKTLKLAVIGRDVSASTSPQIHNFIAKKMGNKVDYQKISVPEENFNGQIERLLEELDGFNVTIPYKLAVIPHLKALSGDAKLFGAVNTVEAHGRVGHNTDGLGFMMMLLNNGINVCGKSALVIGAGGAGRSVCKKLAEAGAKVCVFDKLYNNALGLAEESSGIIPLKSVVPNPYYLVVNASGVGMHNTVGISPVGGEVLSLCEVAVDLIYTPEISKFLQIAQGLGKTAVNGEGMLFYQAYYSECIYFGVTPNAAQAEELFKEYQKEKMQ